MYALGIAINGQDETPLVDIAVPEMISIWLGYNHTGVRGQGTAAYFGNCVPLTYPELFWYSSILVRQVTMSCCAADCRGTGSKRMVSTWQPLPTILTMRIA